MGKTWGADCFDERAFLKPLMDPRGPWKANRQSLGKETLLYEVHQDDRCCRCSPRDEQFGSGGIAPQLGLWSVEVLRLRAHIPANMLQAENRSALSPECLQLSAHLCEGQLR